MRSGTIGIIVFGCGLIAGYCGASINWNISGGCMMPAPIPGIFTGIAWCVGVWILGLFCTIIGEGVGVGHRMYQEAKVRAEKVHSPARSLLRASSADEAHSDILLRSAQHNPGSPPEELLRAGEKPEGGRSE
jgi:hypothetical protein